MTSCQAFYCTNEKGKCEKKFYCIYRSDRTTLVNPSTSDHQKARESTTALATKKKKAYVCKKRVKSDSYLTYGQSCKTYMKLYVDTQAPPQIPINSFGNIKGEKIRTTYKLLTLYCS